MRLRQRTAMILLAAVAAACAGTRNVPMPESGSPLRPCPSSPNCVCSDDPDQNHWIAPLALLVPPDEAWVVAIEIIGGFERTQIVSRTDHYLHAEARSKLMGFIDDLELSLRPERYEIAVRSSSRVGYGDGGVNRARVERLRAALAERGVTRASAP